MDQQFGRWTVIGRARLRYHMTYWRCRCQCGTTRAVAGISLTAGTSRSCGCLTREATITRSFRHGQARAGQKTRAYRRWMAIKSRCENPNFAAYHNYGGRGITVFPAWRTDFLAFHAAIEALGPCPPRWTLDRIDNNRGYEPGNLRWASTAMQRWNQRRPHH